MEHNDPADVAAFEKAAELSVSLSNCRWASENRSPAMTSVGWRQGMRSAIHDPGPVLTSAVGRWSQWPSRPRLEPVNYVVSYA
jgi:hypothetical protein